MKQQGDIIIIFAIKTRIGLSSFYCRLSLPFPLVNKPKKTTRIQEITTKSPAYRRVNLKGGKPFLAKKRSVYGTNRSVHGTFSDFTRENGTSNNRRLFTIHA